MMFVDRFGVVCAFVTNEYLQHGTKNLPNDIRSSIHDTDLYLNNTKNVSPQLESGVPRPLGTQGGFIWKPPLPLLLNGESRINVFVG